jgi:hypothetical protein
MVHKTQGVGTVEKSLGPDTNEPSSRSFLKSIFKLLSYFCLESQVKVSFAFLKESSYLRKVSWQIWERKMSEEKKSR